jgi:hypothetical protein
MEPPAMGYVAVPGNRLGNRAVDADLTPVGCQSLLECMSEMPAKRLAGHGGDTTKRLPAAVRDAKKRQPKLPPSRQTNGPAVTAFSELV